MAMIKITIPIQDAYDKKIIQRDYLGLEFDISSHPREWLHKNIGVGQWKFNIDEEDRNVNLFFNTTGAAIMFKMTWL